MVVEGWLARAAARRPRHPAVIAAEGRVSYVRLHRDAQEGAEELSSRGVRPGERVALALPAGLAFARALHACLELGAVAVPLDTRLSEREREPIAGGCRLLLEEPLPPADGARRRRSRDAPPTVHDLRATAVVIHTSGTTAAPRAVELTYGNLLWSALGSAVALGLDPRERWLCALPVSHVGGLSILVRSAIYATTAVVHERFEADRALDALQRERVTLVSLVATTLQRLLDAGLQAPAGLRCALTGGGPVPGEVLGRARANGVPVGLTYGLTESASQVTTTPVAAIPEGRATAGPPLFCTRVAIASDGEILVRGATVAPGSPSADGWLHTGDIGSLDERGELLVSGRKSDLIVSGGENVVPAEVEAVLESHPDVLEAAVFARADPRWGEAVTAVVVPRGARGPSAEELRAHCALTLAPFKVPKAFVVSSRPLPRTRSGKLLRRELP